jgi:hypothetical protein
LSSWDILSWPWFASLRLHRLTAQSQPKLEKPNALQVAGEKPSKLAVSIDFSLSFSGPASIRLQTILLPSQDTVQLDFGRSCASRARNRFGCFSWTRKCSCTMPREVARGCRQSLGDGASCTSVFLAGGLWSSPIANHLQIHSKN